MINHGKYISSSRDPENIENTILVFIKRKIYLSLENIKAPTLGIKISYNGIIFSIRDPEPSKDTLSIIRGFLTSGFVSETSSATFFLP